MDLGDLEFRPEDFFGADRPNYPDEDTHDWAARVANRLLAERLEKAHVVYGTTVGVRVGQDIKWSHDKWVNLHRNGEPCTTHTARLVCVEELRK